MVRQGNVVLVGHQAVLRCLLAYFLEKPLADLPYIKVGLILILPLFPYIRAFYSFFNLLLRKAKLNH